MLEAVCPGSYWLKRADDYMSRIFFELLLNKPVFNVKLKKKTQKNFNYVKSQ